MKIIGKGEPLRDEQGAVTDQVIIVEITEAEARKITGVDGKPVIAGRFKPGREVNIADVYRKVSRINEKQVELVTAANSLISSANDIKNNIVLTDEE